MRRLRELVAIGAVSATLLLAPVACSSDSTSDVADPMDPGASTIPASARAFEITTSDGEVRLSLDGDLPRGWPRGFPVPDDASPAGSGSLAAGDRGRIVGVFAGSMSPPDAYDFYRTSTRYTVDNSSSLGAGSAYVGTVQFSGSYSGRVTVLSKGGSTTIVVVHDAGEQVGDDG